MSDNVLATISWCPLGVGIRNTDDSIVFQSIQIEEDTLLPVLDSNIISSRCIYLPIEKMLVRHFKLPLKHPKFLDKDILLEELADTAGIEPDDWWITWRAQPIESGIAGMVFGIRKALKDDLTSTLPWQTSPFLLIDGWQRLNYWLTENMTDIAVIDTDAEGMFLGVYKEGTWIGMRRLNADMHHTKERESVVKDALWSLQSMGFDLETMNVTGRIISEFESLLSKFDDVTSPQVKNELPQRHMLNLMLPIPETSDKNILNIRHGSWASKSSLLLLKQWIRPAIITVALIFIWLGLNISENYTLESEVASQQQQMIDAFHRGLPEQTVVIDALAQLRQAAGGNGTTNEQNITKNLYAISKAFKKTPWEMQELQVRKNGISLAGKVENLNVLNTIRDNLSELTGADVQVADTDLNGDEVRFRIRWK